MKEGVSYHMQCLKGAMQPAEAYIALCRKATAIPSSATALRRSFARIPMY